MTAYRSALEACSGLEDCVRTVTRLRTEEGYMAEFAAEPDGSFLLIENHCPICAAAKTCQGFCRSELELFRAAFGAGTSVMRQEHLLSDGRRWVYRVTSLESTDGFPLAPRVLPDDRFEATAHSKPLTAALRGNEARRGKG